MRYHLVLWFQRRPTSARYDARSSASSRVCASDATPRAPMIVRAFLLFYTLLQRRPRILRTH